LSEGIDKKNMSFESKFQPGAENQEEKLAVGQVLRKIQEKTENPEMAQFFDKKDRENSEALNLHPETPLKKTFEISRELMLKIKENPQIIDKRVNFFNSEAA